MNAPAAPRRVLILLAGLVWSAVGIALIVMATVWLLRADRYVIPALMLGLIGGGIVYRFGFLRLVRRNVKRIRETAPGKDRVCVFAFQNTRSYVIIAVMVMLGYTLRHLPLDKVYLAPIYLTIGLGLLLSSGHYYGELRG